MTVPSIPEDARDGTSLLRASLDSDTKLEDACAEDYRRVVDRNAIEPSWKVVEAARAQRRVVPVGLQQRWGEHFKDARR